jgi:flagellar basal body-associated protein FliL
MNELFQDPKFVERIDRRVAAAQRQMLIPFAVFLVIFLLAQLVQFFVLMSDKGALDELAQSQIQPLNQGQAVRSQLDLLAGRTARLAEEGNETARLIVEQFRQQGVSLSSGQTNATPSSTPPAAPAAN